MAQVAPLAIDKNGLDTSRKPQKLVWLYCLEIFGVLYMILSVGLSYKALDEFASSAKSDLFISNFESSVSKIIDTFNNILLTTSFEENIDFLTRSHTSALDPLGIAPVYPRMLMYSKLNTLEFAIAGLRNLAPSQVVKMVSLYCWVDFDRRWEMAYSTKRQERCQKLDYDNGAVVLEAVLRNIKLSAWIKTTNGKFESCIGGPIKHSGKLGQDWYTNLISHSWLSLHDEIQVWHVHGIARFTLQYGTGFGIGIEEAVIVENALGFHYKLQIKGVPVTNRWTYRTTSVFYDLLYNDFYAISPGQSLVRNTTNYFGLIDDTQIEAYDKGFPLALIDQVVHDSIGSLGNIDAKWIAPPDSLVDSVVSFHRLILNCISIDSVFGDFMNKIATTSLMLTPTKWSNTSLKFYGGNPMCGYGSPLPFVQQTFGFDDACGTQQPLTIEWDAFNSLFAYIAVNATWENKLCAQVSKPNLCTNVWMHNSQAFALVSSPILNLSIPTVESYQLSILQFVENDTQLNLQDQKLLDSSFAYFGWMMLYDWAFNRREALAIQGDTNSFNIMSFRYTPLPVAVSVPPAGLAPYFFWLGALVTFTLALVATIAIVLWIKTRPLYTEWIALWSMVSSIWMSRNLLLLRSLMALVCLSTVHLQVESSSYGQNLSAPCRSILMTCLLSGESLWLVYFLHDVCLPITHHTLREVAPWTTLVAWITTIAIDQIKPLQLQANVNRQCYAINMDYMLYCTSGSIKIGSLSRIITIGAIHVSSVVLCILFAWFKRTNIMEQAHRPSLIPLHICALRITRDEGHLNYVALLISGLVPIHFLRSSYLFDIKLWRVVSYSELGGEPGKPPSWHKNKHLSLVIPSLKVINSLSPSRDLLGSVYLQRRGWALLGLAYLGCSLFGNIAYLKVLQTSMANDFGWAGFTTSGMHVFLANLFNEQLLTTTSKSIELENPSFGTLYQQVNATSTTISWYPTIARRQLFQPNTSLEAVVKGLRSLEPRFLPWMFTQYCWLDFKQRWEMASTTMRQLRCQKLSSNGAIYLESSLRNINDWNAWLSAWGDSFELGIANYLKTFTVGQVWLDDIKSNALSISDEIVYWNTHGVTEFVLQWQNYKITGFSDTMRITTALNLQYKLELVNFDGAEQLSYQVSMRMYWSFASDLWAILTNSTSIGSASLLRQSPRYAFANITSEQLLFENYTLVAPLSSGLSVLRHTIGPFNSVDMKYISCPQYLQSYYAAFLAAFKNLTMMNLQAQAEFLELPVKSYIGHVPRAILKNNSVNVTGGNIFCGNDIPPTAPSEALAALFGVSSLCYWWHLEYLQPKAFGFIFALISFQFTHGMSPDYWTVACDLDAFAEPTCEKIYKSCYNYSTFYNASFNHLSAQAHATEMAIWHLNISLIQYITQDSSDANNVSLFQINLFDTQDIPWAIFGWCYMYEWLIGEREVVSFEGDFDIINTVSTHMNPTTMVLNSNTIPTQLSFLCQQCAIYTTCVLMGVTGLAAFYVIFVCHGDVEGLNLFEINRIAGHVWIGRAILFVRSLTALWLLNTTTLELVIVGTGSMLSLPPLAWYKTLLAASELTWLVYILNNILSCLTLQWTPYYSWKSTLCTWLIAVVWTTFSPQHYEANIDRQCDFLNMDSALVCTSAYIQIGSFGRVILDVLIVVISVAVPLVAEILLNPTRDSSNLPTLLLDASSYYMLDFKDWNLHGAFYLDRASAAMAGVLSVKWCGMLYLFDIKSWRLFTTSEVEKQSSFYGTIPLNRVG